MKFEEVKKSLKGIGYISDRNAKTLYDFIIQNEISHVLELGFAHGKASCYIAAALDEMETGELTAVDLIETKDVFKPSIDELLKKTGLEKYVKIYREKTGYSWFLRNHIKENSENHVCSPKYDLCIIDGPKNWTIDGGAFFMVDKLLKPNGWIIFDDFCWTYSDAVKEGREVVDGVTLRDLSSEELNSPHIQDVFQLLVMQHADYSNFKIHGEGDWAWAQKKYSAVKSVTIEYRITHKDIVSWIFRVINRTFKLRRGP